LDELAQCVLFAAESSNNGSIEEEEEEEDISRTQSLFSEQQHPVESSYSSSSSTPSNMVISSLTTISFTSIQQAARYYRASALLGPVPTHADQSMGTAVAWTNFEEKYQGVGEPTFELVLERRQHDESNE
jgi:hypothetical protein